MCVEKKSSPHVSSVSALKVKSVEGGGVTFRVNGLLLITCLIFLPSLKYESFFGDNATSVVIVPSEACMNSAPILTLFIPPPYLFNPIHRVYLVISGLCIFKGSNY